MSAPKYFEAYWKKKFEQRATFSTDAGVAGWSEEGLICRLCFFKNYFNPAQQDKTWLDMGSGAGTYSHLLRNHYHLNVISADYSLPSLKTAARRYQQLHQCVADIYQIPIQSNALGGVICFGVLQVLSNPDDAIMQLKNIINCEGELWLDGLNAWCIYHWPKILREKTTGKKHLKYYRPDILFSDCKEIMWMPILPKKLFFLKKALYNRHMLKLWQLFNPFTRFISHSFMVKIKI